jgi:hypothetical protein
LFIWREVDWRWLLKAHPEIFGKPLQGDDTQITVTLHIIFSLLLEGFPTN